MPPQEIHVPPGRAGPLQGVLENQFILWPQNRLYADSFYKCFNIQTRGAFDIDYATHVYLIEGYLCHDLPTLRHQVLSRYGGFVRKLLQCHSREISFVASMVINDHRSVTCKNLTYLNELTQMNVLYEANWKVMAALPRQHVPDSELWRINLLSTLMDINSLLPVGRYIDMDPSTT